MTISNLNIKEPVLSIQNLSISYDGVKKAVKDVSADIRKNSVTAIMGPRDVERVLY